MSTLKNAQKVYRLFYKSHGTWTPYSGQPLTLNSARSVKQAVKKAYKSSVIIRKVKFV